MLSCTILGTNTDIIQQIKVYIDNTQRLYLRKQMAENLSVPSSQSDILFIINKPAIAKDIFDCRGAVIIITNEKEIFAQPGFVIVSPLSLTYQSFLDAILKATGLHLLPILPRQENSFFIQTGQTNKRIKIYLHDIYYIKALSNYVEIQCTKAKYITYVSITAIHRQLFSYNKFIRIHRSYIINTDYIIKADGGHVLLENSTEIPIGISYKEGFYKFLDLHTLKPKHAV